MDDGKNITLKRTSEPEEISQFAESYAAFNRIINSLQRKYIELKDEFTVQNDQLVGANRKLVELTERNLEATEFLNGILSSLSAGVVAVDKGGVITHFNPAAESILGLVHQKVVGQPYREVISPGSMPHANALRTSETGQVIDSVEKIIDLENGRQVPLSVSTAIIRDAEGHSAGAVEVIHDLTRTKKMERELARLNTLAALGEMAATIAHEVRNPLNGIAGFASLLERDLDENDPRRETATKIVRGVETLNKTIVTLLNYTRCQEINKTKARLMSFLDGAIAEFRSDNNSSLDNVEIELVGSPQVAGPSFKVPLDPVLMRQVLTNLLLNAVQAMEFEGKIFVNVDILSGESVPTENMERMLLEEDESLARIIVSDSGPGIDPRQREKVFSPFFSMRSGGTGLGLAVVWKIVRAHGGDIFVDESTEGGAAFHILLPVGIANYCMEHSK